MDEPTTTTTPIITCTVRIEDGLNICVDSDGFLLNDDDPRWDCATMGNMICGTPPVEIADAVVIERPAPVVVPTELARTGFGNGGLLILAAALIFFGKLAVMRSGR